MNEESRWARARRLRPLVDRSLIVQYRLFGILALVFLGLFVRDLVHSDITVGAGVLALLAGYAMGMILTRGTVFDWNQQTRKVVKQTNVVGIILLVLYLLFIVEKSAVLGSLLNIDDPRRIGAIGTGISAGVMIGRVIHSVRGVALVFNALDPIDVAPRTPPDSLA